MNQWRANRMPIVNPATILRRIATGHATCPSLRHVHRAPYRRGKHGTLSSLGTPGGASLGQRRGRDHPDGTGPQGRGVVASQRPPRSAWRGILLQHRRSRKAPRPPFRLATPRSSRTLEGRRPLGVSLDRRRIPGQATFFGLNLRAARRHLHGGGDVRGDDPPARPSQETWGHPRRVDAGRRFPWPVRLGLRRREPVRAQASLRRPRRA